MPLLRRTHKHNQGHVCIVYAEQTYTTAVMPNGAAATVPNRQVRLKNIESAIGCPQPKCTTTSDYIVSYTNTARIRGAQNSTVERSDFRYFFFFDSVSLLLAFRSSTT